jgi:tripartite ATP-independent transporter DctP family solute receptor
MDRRAFLKHGIGVAGLTLAAPYVARAAVPLNLRLAHYATEDHPAHIAAKQLAARVASRTNGAVTITIFPNNALGSPPEQAEQIKLGVIDMGLPTEGQLDKYDKAFATVELPFVFADYAQAHRVLDGPVMGWWAPLAEKQGFILLAQWEYGFRNLTNNVRPINKPEDVKGLKIRTPPEIQIEASMEALGAVVTKIAFPELYLALSQKTVDGEENPIGIIVTQKFYEVQKHLALTKHVYNNMILTVSAKTWPKLDKQQQAIFREEGKAAGQLMRKLVVEQEGEQLKKLEGFGMKVTKPDPAPFSAKMGPAYKRIAGYAGQQNVDKFLALVKQAG